MPEEPREPEKRDDERPAKEDPRPHTPPETAGEIAAQDILEEDRFEATDN